MSKRLEYKYDPKGTELVMRPKITLINGGGDCDDKTIFCLAWFMLNNITCGYAIVSQRPDKVYHHIFPFFCIDNLVFDFDATFANNKPQSMKGFTARKNKILYTKVNK